MKIEDLRGKKVCLYPLNYIAELLWNYRERLEFECVHIFKSKYDWNKDRMLSMLNQAEILMITEESPLTSLMPPFQPETDFYQMLLSNARKLNMRIVSYELKKTDYLESADKGIMIEAIDYVYLPYDTMEIKKNPILMVTGIHRKQNLYGIIEKMKNALLEGSYKNFIFSNKLYSNMLRCEEVIEPLWNKESLTSDAICIMEGPSENFFLMTKDGIPNEERDCFHLVTQLMPDLSFLYMDEKDSYEMAKETISWYESKGIHIAGAVLEEGPEPWHRVYIEAKLGIPVLSADKQEFNYQFLSLILNRWVNNVEIGRG